MRKLVIVLMTIMSMVLLTACGGSSIGGNIIKDEGSLVKIMDEFKNLDGLKGKEILIFQDVNMYTGETAQRCICLFA